MRIPTPVVTTENIMTDYSTSPHCTNVGLVHSPRLHALLCIIAELIVAQKVKGMYSVQAQ